MIICHCNVISRTDIVDAAVELMDVDPWRPLTPGLVYRQLGKRHKCSGCVPMVVKTIIATVEDYRKRTVEPRVNNEGYQPISPNPDLNAKRRDALKKEIGIILNYEHERSVRVHNEGRSKGYRAAE